MIKHAHLKWHRELIGCVVNVRWWGATCVEGSKGHGGGEDERGDVTGECDYTRGCGCRFGRDGCGVVYEGVSCYGDGDAGIGVSDSGDDRDDVRRVLGEVRDHDVIRGDYSGGDCGGGGGNWARRRSVEGAGGVYDARVESLENYWCCDGSKSR